MKSKEYYYIIIERFKAKQYDSEQNLMYLMKTNHFFIVFIKSSLILFSHFQCEKSVVTSWINDSTMSLKNCCTNPKVVGLVCQSRSDKKGRNEEAELCAGGNGAVWKGPLAGTPDVGWPQLSPPMALDKSSLGSSSSAEPYGSE